MMMERTADVGGHDAILELLPFHVNGSLTGTERERVLAHLLGCTSCRLAEQEERALANALASRHEPVPEAAPGLARLLARIEADAHVGTAGTGHAANVLPFSAPRALKPAAGRVPLAAAATVALAVALVAFSATRLAQTPTAPAYRALASGHTQAAPGTLNVVFAPDLARADIERLLRSLPVSRFEARAQPGTWQIQLEHGVATRATLEAAAEQLRRSPGVLFAAPAPAPQQESLR